MPLGKRHGLNSETHFLVGLNIFQALYFDTRHLKIALYVCDVLMLSSSFITHILYTCMKANWPKIVAI